MVMLILKSSKLFVVSLAFWPLIQILSLVACHIKAWWGLWRLTNWLLRIISIGISLPLEVIISKFFSWFASIWALILGRPCDQRHLALIIGIIIVILWLIIKEWVIIINRLPITDHNLFNYNRHSLCWTTLFATNHNRYTRARVH